MGLPSPRVSTISGHFLQDSRWKNNPRSLQKVTDQHVPLDAIQQKHWGPMTLLEPYLKYVFPGPPFMTYKKEKKNERTFNKSQFTTSTKYQT